MFIHFWTSKGGKKLRMRFLVLVAAILVEATASKLITKVTAGIYYLYRDLSILFFSLHIPVML
jgi:hypothetical protein